MRRFGIGILCAIAGYLIAAIAGYFMIAQFSSNMHDRSVEAAMTSIFFFGPAAAVIGFIVGFIRSRRPASVGAPPR